MSSSSWRGTSSSRTRNRTADAPVYLRWLRHCCPLEVPFLGLIDPAHGRWLPRHFLLVASPTRLCAQWLLLTAGLIVGVVLLSIMFPFFADLVGLLGALFLVVITYTLPMVLALKLLPLERLERRFCKVAVPLSVVVAVAGVGASLISIVSKMV